MAKARKEFVDMKLAIMVRVIKKEKIPKLAARLFWTVQLHRVLNFGLYICVRKIIITSFLMLSHHITFHIVGR